MAEPPRALSLARVGDDPLVVWALASFHTATLTVVPLTALYLDGAVGDLLAGLETSVGLGLYLALWAVTWWANRNVLRELPDRTANEGGKEADDGENASILAVLLVGGKWGGANGVAFFWVLLAGFAALNAPREFGRALEAVPFLLIAGVIGSVLALGVGGIVGALFASLDLVLFRVARLLGPDDPA
jgi:hypothetical protein